jgi:hypothetical protein
VEIRARVDGTGMMKKLAAVRRMFPRGIELAAEQMVQGTRDDIMRECPEDTGRMKRGFAQAFTAVGYPTAEPELKDSRFLDKQAATLEKQWKIWAGLKQMYETTGKNLSKRDGRLTAYYRKVVKAEASARAQLDSFAAAKSAILVYNKGRRVGFTVRTKLYGGTGIVFANEEGRRIYRLINKEPHAIIRERMGVGAGFVKRALRKNKVTANARIRAEIKKRIFENVQGGAFGKGLDNIEAAAGVLDAAKNPGRGGRRRRAG